jgi:hypothetical protein
MTSVVERAAPVLAMSKVTVPLPVTVVLEVKVIHDAVVLDVHEQSGPDAVTITAREAPARGTVTFDRFSRNVQLVPCVTVNVCPAMVIVPVLAFVGFAATVKVTVPLPLPMAPVVTVIHESLLTALHMQPLAAATLTVGPTPPDAPTVNVFGVIA